MNKRLGILFVIGSLTSNPMYSGTASDASFEEWINLLQQKTHQRNTFDHTQVAMNSMQQIVWQPGDLKKSISTTGLDGCRAAALIVQNSNGSRHIWLNHYDPKKTTAQIQSLVEASKKLPDEYCLKKTLIVMVPIAWTKNEDGKFIQIPENDASLFINLLSQGVGCEPIIAYYKMFEPGIEQYFPDFIITIDDGNIVWRHKGDGHILHKID